VVLTRSDGTASGEDPYLVASASSNGIIRVWDVRMVVKEKPNPLAEADTKSRLTCLAGSSIKCESNKFPLIMNPMTNCSAFSKTTANVSYHNCLDYYY
jgi:WD40 repeat protein